MRMPKMSATERAVFAACYAQELANQRSAADNSASESALDSALWLVRCFRRALRDRDGE